MPKLQNIVYIEVIQKTAILRTTNPYCFLLFAKHFATKMDFLALS